MGYYKWIPAFAGMTSESAGMTEKSVGMTQESVGMMGGCVQTNHRLQIFPPPIKTFEGWLQWGFKRRFQLEFSPMNFGKESISRNLIIADMFHRMTKVEKIGSGIKRMRDFMRKAGLKEPNFEMTNFFRVIFYRNPEYSLKPIKERRLVEGLVERLVENQQKMLHLIKNKPLISKKEMAEKLGISTTAIDKNINQLKKKGLLLRVGPDKGGHWETIGI